MLDAVDTTKAYTGKVVLTRQTDMFGGAAELKAGFQFDQRTKVADEQQILLNTAGQFTTVGLPTDYNLFSLNDKFAGAIPMGYTFRYFDMDKMRAVSAAARKNFTFTPNTANNYEVREQVYAGFVMGTVKYDWGSILAGVRVEHLKNSGTAVATVGATTGPVTASSEQTLFFPSFHFNWNLDDTKKFRLSLNSGAARADYDQLRPNVVVSDTAQSISGGNPAVKPERAYGADAYFEWYVQPQGYLMAGLFYKKVEDVLYRQTRTFGSNALDSNGIDRSAYAYSGITNGGDGRVFGMEAAAQFQLEPYVEGWLGGFGVSANVTLNDSKVTKPAIPGLVPARRVRLPGTSDVIYNVGAYYEKYGLSVRVQYQRRSTWLDGIADDLTDGGDTYWAADDEMDISARYAINRNFEIYVDAQNVLNKPGRRYSEPGNLLNAAGILTGRSDIQTIEWERFGARYSAGIRINF